MQGGRGIPMYAQRNDDGTTFNFLDWIGRTNLSFRCVHLEVISICFLLIFSPGGACTAGGSRNGVCEWVSEWVSESVRSKFFMSKRPSLIAWFT